MLEEDTQINTEDQEQPEEEAVEEEETGYKAKTAKRFEELTSKLGDTTELNEKLVSEISELKSTVERLAKSSSKNETDEIMAELEKLDEEQPQSYKDLFKAIRSVSKKMDAREEEQKNESSKKVEDANLKVLESQLTELTEEGLLEDSEKADFTKWCADKLTAGGSAHKYGNLYAALPAWRETLNEKPTQDNSRKAIGPSGGTGSQSVKIGFDELKDMSMAEALKRGRQAS